MSEIDNSLEIVASQIIDRAGREIDGWSKFEDQDLAFNLAEMSGIMFRQLKADREALVEARGRIATLHRKIGELVEAHGEVGKEEKS